MSALVQEDRPGRALFQACPVTSASMEWNEIRDETFNRNDLVYVVGHSFVRNRKYNDAMDGDRGISWHRLPGATLDDCLKRTRAIIGWNKQSGITIILDVLQNSMTRSSTKEIRFKLVEIESLNSRQVTVIVGECCFPPAWSES